MSLPVSLPVSLGAVSGAKLSLVVESGVLESVAVSTLLASAATELAVVVLEPHAAATRASPAKPARRVGMFLRI